MGGSAGLALYEGAGRGYWEGHGRVRKDMGGTWMGGGRKFWDFIKEPDIERTPELPEAAR